MFEMPGDIILERKALKKKLFYWRVIGIILLILIILTTSHKDKASQFTVPGGIRMPYIARIKIDGTITYNLDKLKKLAAIKNNENIKAIILHINSPGGTMVGSESIYTELEKIKSKIPIVAVLGDVAASGGYMVALAADRILSYTGTLTGSIGVIMQSAEATNLLEKIGIKPITIKSSKFKASPNVTEVLDPEVEAKVQKSIMSCYDIFVNLLKKNRGDLITDLRLATNGSLFTGIEAKEIGLVDDFGSEEEALKWLKDEKNIELEVLDYTMEEEKFLKNILDEFRGFSDKHFGTVLDKIILAR